MGLSLTRNRGSQFSPRVHRLVDDDVKAAPTLEVTLPWAWDGFDFMEFSLENCGDLIIGNPQC